VSVVTLNFWFDLEEYLVSSAEGKPKRAAYTPVFRHLLPLLIQAARFPKDYEDLPKGTIHAQMLPETEEGLELTDRYVVRARADLRDEFVEFRNEVKETLLYVQLVLEAGMT
jgi:hypothetical protein